ncbi:hypothetical protein QBC38DRAFT_479619 [Podospora fimiseda]|uniref:Uncharacterized protein n=1 Tax=Podospora fimiseda TaxID=252190 RepID=A0AAN7BNW5_9PEZI|nr:hypothetical protein QBC38DRAFT_479619 [Podospora fimiseda]
MSPLQQPTNRWLYKTAGVIFVSLYINTHYFACIFGVTTHYCICALRFLPYRLPLLERVVRHFILRMLYLSCIGECLPLLLCWLELFIICLVYATRDKDSKNFIWTFLSPFFSSPDPTVRHNGGCGFVGVLGLNPFGERYFINTHINTTHM